MTNVHIYTAAHQPATSWHVEGVGTFYRKPKAFVRCKCCRKRHWAKNCTVQVYYDEIAFWCAEGKGCKNPRKR